LEVKKELLRALKAVPCADCGVRYPRWIMDFDHVMGEKLFNLSTNLRSRARTAILAEVLKCEPLCANCHRHRSFIKSISVAAPHRVAELQAELEGWEREWRARRDSNPRPADP
jgi:hypothetical protein